MTASRLGCSSVARYTPTAWNVCLALIGVALAYGCAQAPPKGAGKVTAFSAASAGGGYPGAWREVTFSKFRKATKYTLIDDCGTVVVEAKADGSSSGLAEPLDIDPREYPWLTWRWKVPELIPGIDNTKRAKDDAPVRIEVSFDGDMKKVPLDDKVFFFQVKALTGLDMPYATLEYVWGDGAPQETVIPNTWTSRIRMLMLEVGSEHAGQWITETRNVVEDYRRAYGEEPGKITALAILTDTDATGEKTTGYYGDIAFMSAKPAAAGHIQAAGAANAEHTAAGLDCPAPVGTR